MGRGIYVEGLQVREERCGLEYRVSVEVMNKIVHKVGKPGSEGVFDSPIDLCPLHLQIQSQMSQVVRAIKKESAQRLRGGLDGSVKIIEDEKEGL